jgi:hypothetical protein
MIFNKWANYWWLYIFRFWCYKLICYRLRVSSLPYCKPSPILRLKEWLIRSVSPLKGIEDPLRSRGRDQLHAVLCHLLNSDHNAADVLLQWLAWPFQNCSWRKNERLPLEALSPLCAATWIMPRMSTSGSDMAHHILTQQSGLLHPRS